MKSEVCRFLTFFLHIRRRGAFEWSRCGVFFICRANHCKGKPAAAAKKGVGAKKRPKTGEKGLKSEFSPFFCTFCVGVLSGGLGAASFPSVEQTIAKVTQQRRQKREGGRKTGRKQVKRGLHKSQSCGTSGQKIEKLNSGDCRGHCPQGPAQAGNEGEFVP